MFLLSILSSIMGKLTSRSITTNSIFPKRFTFFSSVSFFGQVGSSTKFMKSMSKLAFISIGAETHFWEILAHLSFVFTNVCFVSVRMIKICWAIIVSRITFGNFLNCNGISKGLLVLYTSHFKNYKYFRSKGFKYFIYTFIKSVNSIHFFSQK